jgi:hypothetical protein
MIKLSNIVLQDNDLNVFAILCTFYSSIFLESVQVHVIAAILIDFRKLIVFETISLEPTRKKHYGLYR